MLENIPGPTFDQLFVERDDSRRAPPTVQELLEQSFLTSGGIKLKKVPPALILQVHLLKVQPVFLQCLDNAFCLLRTAPDGI